MLLTLATLLFALLQAQAPPAPAAQNPSPMSDTTRPHPRVAQYEPKGQRLPIGQGTLFIREGMKARARLPLIVHFHGAPWVIEHQISKLKQDVVLVTFNIGAGSGVYARPFADAAQFGAVLADAAAGASKILGRQVAFDRIVLTSWSAGYGSIRAILRQPEHYARVSSVVLLDSMHASYAGASMAGPRAEDLPVLAPDVDVFTQLASDAVAGHKQFLILHSEVFPGTYASTTETADAILRSAGVKRRAQLREGPIGMQQLSETTTGKLTVIGYAGNTAPDHVDHLYSVAEHLAQWRVLEDRR